MRNLLVIITIIILCSAGSCNKSNSLNRYVLIPVEKGYSKTSVNATIFRKNSITSHNDYQYIAYYDPDGYVTLGKRKHNSSKWEIHRTQYKGNVTDAHNVICIMVDGDGYLHVAFDHHGHPLNYAMSVAPGSLELGDKIPMVGKDEENVTYPEFYRLNRGNLLFAYRDGSSGRGNLVLNCYSVDRKKWERVQDILIDGENQRNAYWQLYVDRQGTIHLSWVWRESWLVETNHDLCYARSKDNGVTWEKSNGERYTLPINARNAEYAWHIPQNSELINQTSMSADEEGNPFIATYWRDSNVISPEIVVPQYKVVWHNGKEWKAMQAMNRHQPFSLSGGGTKMIPISRPQIVIEDGYLIYIYRDAEFGSKVMLSYSDIWSLNQGILHWRTPPSPEFSVDAWEPSIDTELWHRKGVLNIFVQAVHQGDGEKSVESEPEMIYVLEIESKDKI